MTAHLHQGSSRAASVGMALGRWLGEVTDMAIALALVGFFGWAALGSYVVVRMGWLLSVRLVADGHIRVRNRPSGGPR